MSGSLWNDNIDIDSNLVGKTILLSKFKMREYMETVTLNCSKNSKISRLNKHDFNILEGKLEDVESYQMVSAQKN